MTLSAQALMALGWKRLPAILAFGLLAFQAVMPWTADHFITQDGPSHLYTALVTKDLLLHGHSPYRAVYMLQPKLITNWSTTLLLNASAVLFGTDHTDQVLSTLCVVIGFFAFSYFRRSLDPQNSPWSPLTNFLLNTWFLWIGFYNFYLGMALCLFLVGYYTRHVRDMTRRRVLALAFGLVVLFFTHVLGLTLAIMATVLVGLWVYVVSPLLLARDDRPTLAIVRNAWPPLALMAAAVAPGLILFAIFLKGSGQSTNFESNVEWAWNNFPMHAFASSQGRTGEQLLLYPAMLFYMGIGVLAMRRREWASPRGAIVITAVQCFVFYLLLPNAGFGGDEIKIRLAWAVFVFGCMVASSVPTMQALRTPLSIYITCFLSATLIHSMMRNVWDVSDSVEAYASALKSVPAGSTMVRLRYPTDIARKRFGFEEIALDPLIHADAWVAAQRQIVDLSDYQALSGLFPVVYRPTFSAEKKDQLWGLERMGTGGTTTVSALLKDSPVPIDYVVVLGDNPPPPERAAEFAGTLAEIESTMRLISTPRTNSFVRVYRRVGAAH